MARYKTTEGQRESDKLGFEIKNLGGESKDVVDLAKYKQPEESVNAETSAFEQVLLHLNISDRGAFDSKFTQLWQEASDDNELLSVLICEIDFFKAYNDNYGHQGASFMLLVVGLALKNICEKYDCFLAHYKNQEFAILMKGGDQQKVIEVSESLRKAVKASRTEHKYSNVSKVVTLSIGISTTYPTSPKKFMQEGDSALCEAQTSGRDKACAHFSHKKIDLSEDAIQEGKNNLSGKEKEEEKEEEIIDRRELEENRYSATSNDLTDNQAEEKSKQTDEVYPVNIGNSSLQKSMLEMGVADRSAFHHNFVKLWEQSLEEKELLSMFMCEVDFFAAYVRNYGEQASDDVLLIVAAALQGISKKVGTSAFRIDGEKFVILFKGGNATKAFRISEALHKAIAHSAIAHKYSDARDTVSMSIGLSSLFPSDLSSKKMLMVEASTALREAANGGKNRTSVY
jgi:diguanylate cyclase (GGDEF)-like protein